MGTAMGRVRQFPNFGNNLDLLLKKAQDFDFARVTRIAI
jgi:hypothetical protein